ncbi:MAG: serine hydrolase, partial [Coleofasciculus sp. Co-bin14]|nr:serine hydrolase [Coleofasciculus sp. Co-bin14]
MPDSPKTPQSKGGTQGNRRGRQNSKSIDTSRRRNERTSVEPQPSVRSKSPSKLDNRQREASRSRTTAAVSSGFSPQSSKKNQTSRRSQKRPVSPLVYILRLLILGIGIGAIVGTIISALDPATHASVKNKDTAKTQIQESPSQINRSTALPPGQEILPLKAKIQALVAQNPQLQPGVFIIDLDTGAYLDLNGKSSLAAASTIKVPILVAFFQDVDAGRIRLDEPLTMQPEMMVGGSGDLQYKQPGSQYTALEVATKMIVISDNTATNMLIARLGGAEVLNQRFQSWGLTTTVLRNPLPDIEGTNTTSPSELAKVISIVNRGELVLWQSRDRLLDIMQQTQLNTLLPKGLGTGATIAHKTGTIGSLLADVGLVDTPTGKRYMIAVMVKRSRNDPTADELIRQISRETYSYFNPPRATPSTTSMPIGSTATLSQAIASKKVV